MKIILKILLFPVLLVGHILAFLVECFGIYFIWLLRLACMVFVLGFILFLVTGIKNGSMLWSTLFLTGIFAIAFGIIVSITESIPYHVSRLSAWVKAL